MKEETHLSSRTSLKKLQLRFTLSLEGSVFLPDAFPLAQGPSLDLNQNERVSYLKQNHQP
jgi:hypothetical protein